MICASSPTSSCQTTGTFFCIRSKMVTYPSHSNGSVLLTHGATTHAKELLAADTSTKTATSPFSYRKTFTYLPYSNTLKGTLYGQDSPLSQKYGSGVVHGGEYGGLQNSNHCWLNYLSIYPGTTRAGLTVLNLQKSSDVSGVPSTKVYHMERS